MVRSMTGFGSASSHADGTARTVELRSVNNKYLKTVIRLPEDLQAAEAPLEALLRRKLNRGTVTLTAKVQQEGSAAAMEINRAAREL